MDFVTTGPNQYRVQHDSWMDGGGTWFGQEYIDIVQQRYSGQTFERCYEWCSGPAFIGFGLLDHGLCRSLCVSDIYPDAIARVQETAKIHQFRAGTLLQILVTVYTFGPGCGMLNFHGSSSMTKDTKLFIFQR